MSRPEIDPNDMRDTANLIWGCLDRVARDQGDAVAAAYAIKNLHGNIAYLREALGDVEVVELLGELRETVLARALNDLRKVR
jgi:hypothetical protein